MIVPQRIQRCAVAHGRPHKVNAPKTCPAVQDRNHPRTDDDRHRSGKLPHPSTSPDSIRAPQYGHNSWVSLDGFLCSLDMGCDWDGKRDGDVLRVMGRSLSDAVQAVVSANQNRAIDKDRRGHCRFIQAVLGDHFMLAASIDDKRRAVFACDVEVTVRQNW